MNRKERRAAFKRGSSFAASSSPRRSEPRTIEDLMAEARRRHQERRLAPAQDLCREILARDPSHVNSLNLLGVISQELGRNDAAIKLFAKAIVLDVQNAACHYNIASSYQALDRWDQAVAHFKQAIALGLSDKDIEEFITISPVVAACLTRIAESWPRRLTVEGLFGAAGIASVANDAFLRCALETTPIGGVAMEDFLTRVRFALLEFAAENAPDFRAVDAKILGFCSALAQQCFINEYVFAQSDDETRQAQILRDLLIEKLTSGSEIAPLLLAAVAMYFPLHSLAPAESLLDRDWPDVLSGLLRQQLREPLEEARERQSIPALTAVDDGVSLHVRQQYEENPYPRWIAIPPAASMLKSDLQPQLAAADQIAKTIPLDILVAGCGTGQHSINTAQTFPMARVLAVDISLASLAYARRKTREAGVRNIDYAQADILRLGSIGRSFDRIEVVGVLHHLADPQAGWRVLLSLLRPGGVMCVGLYSTVARRAIAAARALIAERKYGATVEDIRAFRQELIGSDTSTAAKKFTTLTDFYNTSGCRDLLFNVMEHTFTIPDLKAFLAKHELSFLGFEVDAPVLEAFRQRFLDPAALTDLDRWHLFEAANPHTFLNMYVFRIQRLR